MDLALELPAGRYRAEWVHTGTGRVDEAEVFDHAGGERVLASPRLTEDIALQVKSRR